jgi:hypothetical protein
MRNLIFCIVTIILVWLAVYLAIPGLGYPVRLWVLITSASVSAIFAWLIVLLGESVVEDIVKLVILAVLSAILSTNSPKLEFVFACTMIAGILGIVMNHINQFAAGKASNRTP